MFAVSTVVVVVGGLFNHVRRQMWSPHDWYYDQCPHKRALVVDGAPYINYVYVDSAVSKQQMSIIQSVVAIILAIYDLLSGFFSTLGPSVLVSLLTAVVTVQLTFWYHDRRDGRNALQAFESEIHLNDMETEMMIHDIFGHRDGFEDDSDTRTTVRLATSGYDKMKTTGTLTKMPYNANKSIRSYYTMVRLINRSLQQREDVRYNLPWEKREHAIETVDNQLLTYICTICGPARLELVADRLNENEEVEEQLREYAERKSGRESGEPPIYGDYEEVSYYLSEKRQELRILPRWNGIKERLPGDLTVLR